MEVFPIVATLNRQPTINARSYLMSLEKNKGDLYSWYCFLKTEKYCPGRASTKLVEGKHFMRKCTDHNHPARRHLIPVALLMENLKIAARDSDRSPSEIIQTIQASASPYDRFYIPSESSMLAKINKIRQSQQLKKNGFYGFFFKK